MAESVGDQIPTHKVGIAFATAATPGPTFPEGDFGVCSDRPTQPCGG